MSESIEMNTVSEILGELKDKNLPELVFTERGFTADGDKFYQPEDIEIVKVYRFEGISDPSDMSVIYILQTHDGLTGYSLNAYGAYSDKEKDYDNFLRRIPEKDHQGQLLFQL
jgi:hypothetical protein